MLGGSQKYGDKKMKKTLCSERDEERKIVEEAEIYNALQRIKKKK